MTQPTNEVVELDRGILPFGSYQQDKASVFYMLHKALMELDNTWTQPPHWDREPTQEMLAEEQLYLEDSNIAQQRVEELAGKIYLALTGKVVIATEQQK